MTSAKHENSVNEMRQRVKKKKGGGRKCKEDDGTLTQIMREHTKVKGERERKKETEKRKKSSRMQQEGWKKGRNDLRALLVSPSLSE